GPRHRRSHCRPGLGGGRAGVSTSRSGRRRHGRRQPRPRGGRGRVVLQVFRRAHRRSGAQERGALGLSELVDRLLARDASLWPEGNVSANRLGWLDVPERMRYEASELAFWVGDESSFDDLLLLGMGGSSLGSEVLNKSFGDQGLIVLDTTDPATIA